MKYLIMDIDSAHREAARKGELRKSHRVKAHRRRTPLGHTVDVGEHRRTLRNENLSTSSENNVLPVDRRSRFRNDADVNTGEDAGKKTQGRGGRNLQKTRGGLSLGQQVTIFDFDSRFEHGRVIGIGKRGFTIKYEDPE